MFALNEVIEYLLINRLMSKEKYYVWSAIGRFGTQITSFIGNILIARVLMPSDYGLIAMLAIVMGLAWNFTESGFADCLIRKQNADKQDFGTVATFNLVVAIVIYIVIFFLAPHISNFFDQKELTGIARVLGISLIIRAVTLPAIVQLQKKAKFKPLAIMQLLTSVISITLTYLMALNGYGYMALAVQPILIAMANLFFMLIATKWRPFFCFNFSRFKGMYNFGIDLMVSYITNQFGNNLYSAIIGKFYPVNSLGYYQQAIKMQEIPTQGLNAVILTTSYPLIASETDSNKQIIMYRDIFTKFVALQSIMVLVLIGLAEPIWLILLGEKWAPAIPYFRLFMIISLVYPLVTVNSNIAKIHNESGLYRNLTFLRNGLKVIALILLTKTSLLVILYGQIIAAYISVLVDMYFCGKIINFGVLEQLKQFIKMLYKPVVAYIAATLGLYFLKSHSFTYGIIWSVVFFSTLIVLYLFTRDRLFFQAVKQLKFYFEYISSK